MDRARGALLGSLGVANSLQIPSFIFGQTAAEGISHIAEIHSNAVARRTALARAHTATEPEEKMMRPGIILLREGTDTSQVSPSGLDGLSGDLKVVGGDGVVMVVVLRCLLVPPGYSPHLFVLLLPPARIPSCARSLDNRQGKAQLVSNINACQAVADAVRTTLGPRGMDKLIFDGRRVTISNDGATIMKLLEIAHPAAKTLVDISMSQVRA